VPEESSSIYEKSTGALNDSKLFLELLLFGSETMEILSQRMENYAMLDGACLQLLDVSLPFLEYPLLLALQLFMLQVDLSISLLLYLVEFQFKCLFLCLNLHLNDPFLSELCFISKSCLLLNSLITLSDHSECFCLCFFR
jgi:hypothetical protein